MANFGDFLRDRIAERNAKVLTLLGQHAMALKVTVLGEPGNDIEIDRIPGFQSPPRAVPLGFSFANINGMENFFAFVMR